MSFDIDIDRINHFVHRKMNLETAHFYMKTDKII